MLINPWKDHWFEIFYFLPFHRASMIWIIGEYAERIDNAAELLESFLEGFQDENAQVQSFLLVLPGLVMNTYTMFYQSAKKVLILE